jgi:hypothetical protein
MSSHAAKLRGWSIGGFFAITLLGILYHYLYEWSDKSALIAPIAPVNESVWEHLKLGLWAVISFSVAEYFVLGKAVNNYFFTKAIGVFIISFTILLIYYTYTMFLDRTILLLDISSYIVGVLLCQLFCYKVFKLKHSSLLNILGFILLISFCVIFAIFTFYPPQLEIFKDHNLNIYGIETTTPDHNKK